MAQFQQIVLDYLEHYRPDEYAALKQEKRLRAYLDDLVEQLYAEAKRIRDRLATEYPDRSDEQLTLEAERTAARQLLPISGGSQE